MSVIANCEERSRKQSRAITSYKLRVTSYKAGLLRRCTPRNDEKHVNKNKILWDKLLQH